MSLLIKVWHYLFIPKRDSNVFQRACQWFMFLCMLVGTLYSVPIGLFLWLVGSQNLDMVPYNMARIGLGFLTIVGVPILLVALLL